MSELSLTRFKKCLKCNILYPAFSDYFHRHKVRKDGLSNICKACARAHARAWTNANPEKANARARQWTKDHPEQRRAIARKSYYNNLPKAKASKKAYIDSGRRGKIVAKWREANRDLLRAYFRQYYADNKDRITSQQAQWRAENPETSKVSKAKRRARELKAEGWHSTEDIIRILHSQQELCFYCGMSLSGGYHVDHRIPLSRGGTNWPDNLVCACATCNLRKHNKTDTEFIELLSEESDDAQAL